MTDAVGVEAFESLGSRVRSALAERGFEEPTEPQRLAIPALARGEHGLVVAPTGSGKTETAMLPVLDALAADAGESSDEAGVEGFGALYVTPLRALNRDMRERLEWWGDELDLAVDVRHGDTSDYRRRKQATDPPDVLVTTPETLQATLTGSRLREALSTVEHVVVDEVHELAASKRGAQLSIALERLAALAGEFQRVGLSATVGEPAAVAEFLTGGRDCGVHAVDVGSRLDVEVNRPEVTEADERLAADLACDATAASHVRAIEELVAANESTLVFVNTRQTAEALGARCKAAGVPLAVHHGSLSKEARLDAEDRFKDGDLDALLCTSSMELGIDVGRVDHVVQFRSPRQVTRLLQRVGRAGHREGAVSSGTVVATDPDDVVEAVAIARRARAGLVEPARVHEGSLDVVANQVVALALCRDGVSAMAAYDLVTRAAPYHDLDRERFKELLRELSRNRVCYLDEDGDRVEPSGGTRGYVYQNLSMIPDEETYAVEDVARGGRVGSLDERFVVNFAEPGATFVQRGEIWRVVTVEDEESVVRVSPVEDPAGEVPSWTGQEIPVPPGVAGEVGELRRSAAPQLASGAEPAAVARDLARRYPAEPAAIEPAVDVLADHVREYPVPTDDRVVVEGGAGTVVVGAALGHRANEALGRMLSSLVGQRTGSSVGVDAGPYRVELDVPGGVSATDVAELLRETDPEHVRPIVELSLKRSDRLVFRLSTVARKFGALDGDGVGPRRLVAALEDTAAYEEAVRVLFHEEMDVAAASETLAAIQGGDLDLAVVGGHTPLGRSAGGGGTDLVAPENADADVVETVRERIQDDRVRLFCCNCADWERTTTVGRVDQPQCPDCEATRVAALHPAADEAVDAVRAVQAPQREADADQQKRARRAYRNASLVQTHGHRAVAALAARGVGPENAARIINNHREDELDFYRDVLEREREYARTKSFWD